MYGFDPRHRHHVAADGISSAATFCKSHLSLILSRLLPNCDPLRGGAVLFFDEKYEGDVAPLVDSPSRRTAARLRLRGAR